MIITRSPLRISLCGGGTDLPSYYREHSGVLRDEARPSEAADGPRLLGTGGALKQAQPLLGRRFFVLYGDSYLPMDYGSVSRAFLEGGKPALMTVFKNDGRWDTSNVWFEAGEIRLYDKTSRRARIAPRVVQ